MGQNNSRRVSHDIDDSPNTFRDDQLRQILDDIDEELTGKGYTEILRSGVFVDEMKIWDEPTNNPTPNPDAILRKHIFFTRAGSFISSILTNYYTTDGLEIIAASTETYVRDVGKRVLSINTVITRP